MICRRHGFERLDDVATTAFLLTKLVSDRADQPEEARNCRFVGLNLTQRYTVGNSINN
jgi:hypothetical protein